MMRKIVRNFAAVLLLVSIVLAITSTAQVRPINDYGALGLGQMLRRLQTTASVLMIGAHPDDEDSALLAYLARGENARTGYLSLTRGDGGQNIIGPELFESLGVIRTEELLQARRLDGAEQYFTRAYDYGFSKTLAEARAKWPEDEVKCDVVRVIRSFRPVVVISRFTGTPRDGHGQHQYAGYISPIAVKAAADPQQCVEAGEPWTVKKFYVESGFGDNAEPTLRINTGQYDPILGRTYFEIAMEGRSQHRSQGEGRIEFHGDSFSGLNLVDASKQLKENDIFDGLELEASARGALGDMLSKPIDLFNPQGYSRGLAETYALAGNSDKKDSLAAAAAQETERNAAAAFRIASGIQLDALADSETISPGGRLMVSVKAFQPKDSNVRIGAITLSAPSGWSVEKTDPPKQNNAAYNSREAAAAGAVFNVHVDPKAELTEPYWLRTRRKTDLFDWPETPSRTLPFDPPLLVAHVTVNIDGTDITLDQPVQYRYADPARGEVRREINVVPPVSVDVVQKLLIVPVSIKSQTRHLDVTATKNVCEPIENDGELTVRGNAAGWALKPLISGGDLAKCGDKATSSFLLTIPGGARPGRYSFTAQVEGNGFSWGQTMNIVAYPHIQTHRYYTPAVADVLVLDLKTAPLNVGYIMGSGDTVPESIREMGIPVTMLDEKDLSTGDLSKYETIVVGVRASETRADFVANNKRLLDYVKNGGNLIVQYQRGNFAASGLLPFPADAQDRQRTAAGSISRVVDENAPVTILQPQNPIFNLPNKITDADFMGWVQERNAYNLVTFDSRYTSLLESHDEGEQPNNGGMVIANIGKGTYIYTSYSWFRQLPAGVPGAYRIFANMLNLPKTLQKKS
jgi:LmbE family N-acetylglucosaminyl deacetylase